VPWWGDVPCDVLACSYCLTVSSASWWTPSTPRAVALLLLVGSAVAVWGLRPGGSGRSSTLLVAAALVVVLPAAALIVRSGRVVVDLEATQPPVDGPTWQVTCEAAFLGPRPETQLGQEAWDTCDAATATRRRNAIGLASVSALMVAVGVGAAPRSHLRSSRRSGPPDAATTSGDAAATSL
jgi:hypothetical protein